MNALATLNSISKIARPLVSEVILNGDFTSPIAPNGNFLTVTAKNSIPNWVFDNMPYETRILNNSPQYAGPPNWNNVPVKTALCVIQGSNTPINLSQTINMSSIKTYNVSLWAVNQAGIYNMEQKFRLFIDGVQVIGPISFPDGSTTRNWAKFTGTYTPSTTGNKVVTLRWNYTLSTTTSMIVTDVIVI